MLNYVQMIKNSRQRIIRSPSVSFRFITEIGFERSIYANLCKKMPYSSFLEIVFRYTLNSIDLEILKIV